MHNEHIGPHNSHNHGTTFRKTTGANMVINLVVGSDIRHFYLPEKEKENTIPFGKLLAKWLSFS